MVTSYNLFRNYILWRARIVRFLAAALAVVLLMGLLVVLASDAPTLNRFGLLLQLLGLLSLVPHAVGKARLRRMLGRKPAVPPLKDVLPPDGLPPAEEETTPAPSKEHAPRLGRVGGEALFTFYRTRNLALMVGNLTASLALMTILAYYIFRPPEAQANPGLLDQGLVSAAFSLLGFAWLDLFMLIQVYLISRVSVPRALLAWFFALDLLVGMIGLVFAALAYIVLDWVRRGLNFLFENGARRVVLVVALPFMITGIFFELLAALL